MDSEIINYEAVLADLEAKKASIENTIIGVKQILGQETAQPKMSDNGFNINSMPSDAFFGMSIPKAFKKFLNAYKKPASARMIAASLEAGGMTHSSKNFTNNVRTILGRIEKETGEIVRIKKEWGLAEWYPGMKNKTKKAKPENEEEKNKQSEDLTNNQNEGEEN